MGVHPSRCRQHVSLAFEADWPDMRQKHGGRHVAFGEARIKEPIEPRSQYHGAGEKCEDIHVEMTT